jgi:L-threonylcarbamoyladenylate synthase
MELLPPTPENIARAARALAEGRLVVLPTETVYGLGANAFDVMAVARVFEAKRRPSFDPLIVHIADLDFLAGVASFPSAMAAELARVFWPGPLTLILPKRGRVPALVTSGLDTVAVRMPAHPVARQIIRLSGVPVAAPSANPFGYLSPTRAEHVVRLLGDRVDLVVDGGPCEIGVESTVLDVTGARPLILRPGGLSRADLEAVCGPVGTVGSVGSAGSAGSIDRTGTVPSDSLPPGSTPISPGQLESHYSPRTPLRLLPRGGLASARPGPGTAALFFDEASRVAATGRGFAAEFVLSPSGDHREAAASLFVHLHTLDAGNYEEIWAERVPEDGAGAGLGSAVNDRLWKASRKE